jgi:hypothetical protein
MQDMVQALEVVGERELAHIMLGLSKHGKTTLANYLCQKHIIVEEGGSARWGFNMRAG